MGDSTAKPERRKDDREAREVAQRHKHEIAKIQYAMQDAWLTGHGLTRFVRFILTIFIAFIAATAFVQTNERKSCNTGKVFLRSYTNFVKAAAESREKTAKDPHVSPAERANSADTASAYRAQIELLRPGIEQNCNGEYPIVPLIGI